MLDQQEPVISIRNLTFAYGEGEARKEVLTDNNLDLYAGELVIMSGPSGSGKTTLLSLIGALRTPQQGSLRVLGAELKGFSRPQLLDYRRRVGFIFQHHNLFPALTAYQSVRMALDLQGGTPAQKDEQIRALLERLGLGQRMHYKPERLSGGQRQRVAIARALAPRPKLVLADEPTAALDKDTGRNVVDLLKELVKQNDATALMVTHDTRLLDAADRLVNMIDGRVVSNVRVADVLESCGLLRETGLFSANTPSELMEVAQKMAVRRYAAGEALITQGEEGDRFYMLRHGSVDVRVRDGLTTRTVSTLERGAFFGERALIAKEPRNATVVAREPVEVFSLDKEEFEEAIARSKSFKDQLLSAMFHRG